MCPNITKLILFLAFISLSYCNIFFNTDKSENYVENSGDGKSSLVFVFDTTGSMHNDLKQLREGAEMILKTALEESNIIGDFVFVPFHDPAVGPATVTRDKGVFKNALELVNVYGGGDCPEKSLGGITLALKVSQPRSFIYVFTDATAGDHRLVGKVLDAVQRKQSQVVFVLTGHCNDLQKPSFKVYQQIAAASSGQVFNLNKTNVHNVLDFVKSSIKGRMVNLGTSVNPGGFNLTQEIPVDSSLGEVTVSVSGAKPQITVVDPHGEQLTGPPKLVTTLDLSEIMVVKVIQPEPGNWTITVGSDDDYSVKVVGLSNLTFEHGFSVEPPKTMAETSYRPLEGTYNHMMISLSQSEMPVTIDYAEILTLEGKTLFELPLTKDEKENGIYLAEAFIPPEGFFYIAINGKDGHGHELRRTGGTAVQAKLPDVPYLSTPKKLKVHSHSRVVLKCKVESLVPVTAVWTKDAARIQDRISSLQTTTIEYIIEDMTEGDVGSYRCNARNVAGSSTANTDLILLVDPPQVIVEPTNLTLVKGDNATISCTVFSEALLLKFQFFSQNNDSREVIDIAVEPSIDGAYTYNITVEDAAEADVGNYTCVASNRGGSSNSTANLKVLSDPTAQILGPHEISTKLHDVITLYCLVTNSGAISWTNNGTVWKDASVNGSHTGFFAVNVTEDGSWECKASRGDLEVSDTVQISVLLPPVATILGTKNVTVVNGTTVEIVCEVTAKPPPRILWYRGIEEKFLNNTTTVLDSKTYRSVLRLNSTTQDINGTYYCVGENNLGIHQDSATILVRRKMVVVHGFNDTSVKLYEQIKLHCNVDAYPPPEISWSHNSTELDLNKNVHISEDDTILTISKVDFDDLGLYSCVAENGFENVEVNATLNVYGLDAPQLSKDQPTRRFVKQGDSTNITCRILIGYPEPELKWEFKSPKSENFTVPPNRTRGNGSELFVYDVTIDNSGLYRCVAENVVGRDEFTVELVVHYPPQFKSATQLDQKPLEVAAGETVKFSCEAVGFPPPIVLWNKDGRPLVYGKNSRFDNGTLVIDKVTEYDSGLITCNAKSPMGSVQKNFTLFVYVPPKISPSTIDTEQEILEGQLVELPCDAKGVPPPEVLWHHNGNAVDDHRKYIDEFGIRFVANLTDFGDYTCIARNQYGNTSISYSLFIWVPPYIEPPIKTIKNVIMGRNESLHCDVVGFPVPSIRWEFQQDILTTNTTDLSFNDVGNLYLTNASSKHEGAYVCVAENIAGDARKYFYVNIIDFPRILEENYTGPFLATNMDSAVTIACNVVGKPKPYVVWSKDDYYLDKDVRYDILPDGTLTIKSPTEDMSGNYTCTATNAVGTTNKTHELMVYSLPTHMQSEDSHPSVTVLEHTNTNVECPTRASHTDTVKWYKDAELISTGNLQLSNITRDDQTTYACVVTNAVGSGYSAVSLSVEWPPKFLDDIDNDIDESIDENDGDKIAKIKSTIEFPDAIGDIDNDTDESNYQNRSDKIGNSKSKINDNIDRNNDVTDKNIEDGATNKNIENVSNMVVDETDTSNVENHTINYESTQNDRGAPEPVSNNNSINAQYNNGMKPKVDKTAAENGKTKVKQLDKRVQVIQVVKGDDTYLDCSVDAKPIAKTKWLFNSKPVVFENRERFKLLNVQGRNAGVYKCVVGNIHGTLVKEFRLAVLEPPFISEFDVLDVSLMEGVNATLECEAKGIPEPVVKWKFNNTNWRVEQSTLTAANVSSSFEGLYRCDAKNDAGIAHIVYRVGVVSRAKIEDVVAYRNGEGISVTGSVEAELGSHIRIACKSTGKPTPTVQWLRNGKVLSENKKDINYADLTIDGVETSNAGIYSCVTSNEGGNDERKIRFEVLEPPRIFRTVFQSEKSTGNTVDLEVLSGQAYYLHCHAYGNPVPELYWFRDGLPLMLFDDTMVSTDFGEVIEVRQALEVQSGNYTCVARNKVGNTSIVYLVDVLVPPPSPKEASIPTTSRVGRRLKLACPAHGSPAPLITWTKHPYIEIGEHTPRVALDDGNATLIINSAQVSDSGNYSCIMTNKAGTTEVLFDVTIEKPPSIAGNLEPGGVEMKEVALGKSILLKCEADGHPLPKITWLKDTQQLSDSTSNINRVLGNSLLVMWRVTSRDAGQYICLVENTAGAVHRRYNVRVKVPGKWNDWGQWSYCNVTCGLGHQVRTRSCQYIDKNNNVIDKSSPSDKLILDESACKGAANETRKCHMPACEEPPTASWSPWSRWAPCSMSCGTGTQARTRRCRGGHCGGDNVQIRKCLNLPKCENNRDETENDVFDTKEDFNQNNNYAPEAVFEMEPEIVNSHYSPDVEEFYMATGSKQESVFYDVNVTEGVGSCAPGHAYDVVSHTCEDIDECVSSNNKCHATQVCANTVGAYRCGCSPGLLSLGAGRRCMDINECTQDISGCEYACVNVVGGYVCACPSHMRLHADKHHCYPALSTASSYRKSHSYEDTSEYLSTSVEYPARYKHRRN